MGSRSRCAQAASELTAIARRLQEQFPVENARKRGVRMVGVIDGIVGPFRTALLTLFAAVGAVLLIACANLANLMLTRAASRRKDLAVQLALGSSRANVVRQVLVEALLVGVSGGMLGVLVAQWGVVALVALAPTQLPRSGEIRVDVAVLMFSLAVSSLTGVLFGVIPALASASVDVRDALQGGGRGDDAPAARRIRGRAGQLRGRARRRAAHRHDDAGEELRERAGGRAGIRFDAGPFGASHAARKAIQQSRRDRHVPASPRAANVVVADGHAYGRDHVASLERTVVARAVHGGGQSRSNESACRVAQFRTVSAGYFEAARIPLKRGRTFSERDTDRTRAVAVVNEELASQWLDGLEPIGARLLVDDNDGPPRPVEIIGVVGNVQQVALDGEPTWDLYLTYPQIHPDNVGAAAANMFWIVRTTGDPMNLATSLAREVRRIDPEVVASQIRPMDHYLSDAVAPRRFSLSLMAAFALAALALAITGIYAVVMYSVSQRAREIGIRVALGASRSNIVRLVMGHGIRFILIGLCVGNRHGGRRDATAVHHALRPGGHGCRDIWPGRRGRRRGFGARLRGADCARRETGCQAC